MRITIYTNGQIAIPAKIRRGLDIKPGDSLTFFMDEEHKEIIMCKSTSVQVVLDSFSALERAKHTGGTAEYGAVQQGHRKVN